MILVFYFSNLVHILLILIIVLDSYATLIIFLFFHLIQNFRLPSHFLEYRVMCQVGWLK
jgi:hypothetical protein